MSASSFFTIGDACRPQNPGCRPDRREVVQGEIGATDEFSRNVSMTAFE